MNLQYKKVYEVKQTKSLAFYNQQQTAIILESKKEYNIILLKTLQSTQ